MYLLVTDEKIDFDLLEKQANQDRAKRGLICKCGATIDRSQNYLLLDECPLCEASFPENLDLDAMGRWCSADYFKKILEKIAKV
jgi:hypothetical protein